MELIDKLKEKLGNTSQTRQLSEHVPGLVKPNSIQEYKDRIEINRKLNRVLMVTGWPSKIRIGLLNRLLDSEARFQLTLRIQPINKESAVSSLNRLLTKQKSDLEKTREDGKNNPALEQKIKDTRTILDDVRSGEENLFWTSLNINVQAEDPETLDMEERRVKSMLHSIQLISKIPEYNMKKAVQTVMPFNPHQLDNQRRMPTSGLAEIFPFTSSQTKIQENGILLGFNKGNPVIKDFYQQTNPNWLIAGTSGSGKSFTSKLITSRYAEQGVNVDIIDPHGEYRETVKQLNGQIVEISSTSKNGINPLGFQGHTSFQEKMLSLRELFQVMIGGQNGLTEPQKAELFKAVRTTYREKGIRKENFQQAKRSEETPAPVLSDLHQALKNRKKTVSDGNKRQTLEVLISRLDKYVNGVLQMFNTRTSMNTSKQVTCFDISKLPDTASKTAMYLVLDYLYSNMTQGSQDRNLVVVDEAWKLLSNVNTEEAEESFLFNAVKSSRKFNTSVGLIIQDTNDLVSSEIGENIKANTSTKILLKQDETVLSQVSQFFSLNTRENKILRQSQVGEGILISDGHHIPLQIQASQKERGLAETEPGWQQKQTDKQIPYPDGEEFQKNSYSLEKQEDIHLEENLDEDKVEELKQKNDWKRTTTSLFSKGRGKKTWVKCRGSVSPRHQKVVKGIKMKAQEISEKQDVELQARETRNKADLEFLLPEAGETIGVEVEAGGNKGNKKRLESKADRNNSEYNQWFMVCLDYEDTEFFESFCGDVVLRTEVVDRLEQLFSETP